MIDYYQDVDFSRTVFIIEDGQIEDYELAELCNKFAIETTTPRGIGKLFHVRGKELWTWGPQGNCPSKVADFDSLEEAEHALLLTFLYELMNGDDNPMVYDTLDEANAAMIDEIAEMADV